MKQKTSSFFSFILLFSCIFIRLYRIIEQAFSLRGVFVSYLTDEEIQVASRFLFLSMAIVVIQLDVQNIKEGAFKIKKPYIEFLNNMATVAINKRKQLQKVMKDHHIQVVSLHRNQSFSSYLFICQGREEKRSYFNPAIRKKVEAILRELIHETRTPNPAYVSSRT